ncbi:MAG TPA: TIGR00282 family metallophosphoesterase [Dehalococcoidia bacterium]|nr:TIGR00282 family metallophosphoesterase [Dehalococcoidia bacterium]
MKVLFVGDIVGRLGRRTVQTLLPAIRRETEAHLVIANGENAAGGRGLTLTTAEELFDAGVDIITSGNHIWEHREIYPLLEGESPIIRPLNYPPGAPGHGLHVRNGVAVINLIGRTFMGLDADCPFRGADAALADLQGSRVVIIDIHAEATSEKVAMGWYLDGRVSAVIGTHTHVATADAHILPKGTAFVCDVGMVGPLNSIIGMEIEPIVERFLTQLPTRFSPVEKGPTIFNSVFLDIDDATGRALRIERIDREVTKHGQ